MCSPASVKILVMPTFCAMTPDRIGLTSLALSRARYSLISTSTPAARSSFISASTVCGVGSTISSSRLWVRISNCSRLFLSICGERFTVNFSILVGSGIGPRTSAPVRLAVLTISFVEASRTRWSNAFSRMRIFWPCMSVALKRGAPRGRSPLPLFYDAGHDAGADGAAAFADGEAQTLFHGDRHDQFDVHRDIVTRHHHLGALGQRNDASHVRGAEVELRTVIGEERG